MSNRWTVFYLVLGGLFLVTGTASIVNGKTLDGAWQILMGGTQLFIAYNQRHPERVRGPFAWLMWGYIAIFAVVSYFHFFRS